MNRKTAFGAALLTGCLLFTSTHAAADDTLLGALVGGSAGLLLGQAVGGRDGAIVGIALGAVAGAAIAGDRDEHRVHYHPGHRGGIDGWARGHDVPRVRYIRDGRDRDCRRCDGHRHDWNHRDHPRYGWTPISD